MNWRFCCCRRHLQQIESRDHATFWLPARGGRAQADGGARRNKVEKNCRMMCERETEIYYRGNVGSAEKGSRTGEICRSGSHWNRALTLRRSRRLPRLSESVLLLRSYSVHISNFEHFTLHYPFSASLKCNHDSILYWHTSGRHSPRSPRGKSCCLLRPRLVIYPPHHDIDRLGPGTAWLINLDTDETELSSTWEDDYFSDAEVYEPSSTLSTMW